jgi:hypothetical protein
MLEPFGPRPARDFYARDVLVARGHSSQRFEPPSPRGTVSTAEVVIAAAWLALDTLLIYGPSQKPWMLRSDGRC